MKELLTEDEDVAELEQHRQTFKREINLMKSMKPHPNVLNVLFMICFFFRDFSLAIVFFSKFSNNNFEKQITFFLFVFLES